MCLFNAVSIVIPLYNKVNHIRRAIESVQKQTYGNYEIVVVDDGSTDNSPIVAKRHLRSDDKLIHQSNQGAGFARNTGIAGARHELIAFLDADDAWLPDHLETLVLLVERYNTAQAFGTGYAAVRGSGKVALTVQIAQDRLLQIGEYFRYARPYPLLHSSNSLVRKSVLVKVGGYPTAYRRDEDLVFTARLAMKTGIAIASNVTAAVYLDAENRSSAVRGPFVGGPWFERELFGEYIAMERETEHRDCIREYMACQLLHTAYSLIIGKEAEHARCYLNSQCVEALGLQKRRAWLQILSRRHRSVIWIVRMLRRARLAFPLGRRTEVLLRLRRWPC